MWAVLRIYLLCGVVVIGIEYLFLVIGGTVPHLFHANRIINAICNLITFLLEVVIWPRQLFVFVYDLIRLLTGKVTLKDLMKEAED